MNYKGEWRVGESFGKGQDYPIYADDDYEIARVFIHNGEQTANAHLIASAPTMYEALQVLQHDFITLAQLYGISEEGINTILRKSNNALAKAEGKV